MPLTLYAFKESRSNRVRWLCKELGISFTVRELDESDFSNEESWYRSVNPLGRVPGLVDGDLPPIFESGAILTYLMEKHGNGRLAVSPTDPRYGQFLQWMWAGEACVMPAIDQYYDCWVFAPEELRDEKIVSKLRWMARACFGVAERLLECQRFVLGDSFTAADIMLGYGVYELFKCELLGPADLPNLAEYLARLEARPACCLDGRE
jgi:glutathione S-transferase